MNRKAHLIVIALILSSVACVSLFIMLQYSQKYYHDLEGQIEERNSLITALFNDLILDNSDSELLYSLCLSDTLASKSAFAHSVSDIERLSIHGVIEDYIKVVAEHDSHGYANLFADEVARFFLRDSLSNEEVYDETRWYWKRYPNIDMPTYSLHNMPIDKNEFGFIVFLPSKRGDCELVTKIKLNRDLKIFYIRDYYADMSEQTN